MEGLPGCELCNSAGGTLLWQNGSCRVVEVGESAYPGFCRVVLNRHVREMTDLPEDQRRDLLAVVFAVESVLRELLRPDKINLASLGNMTPHLHWHVIPRFRDDRHFPGPVWSASQREAVVPADRAAAAARLGTALAARLGPSVP